MPLNPTEILVVLTKTMRYSEKEALKKLKEKGHEMRRDEYYKILARVTSQTKERLYEICKNMKERHIDRINDVEMIRGQLVDLLKEPGVTRIERLKALHELRELQPYISAYDEAAQGVLEDSVRVFGEEEHVDVSSLFVEKK